ncbi:MAG: hypothetical protein ABSG32_25315 [Terriglobia bacterium]|jgi:hypothetical protein
MKLHNLLVNINLLGADPLVEPEASPSTEEAGASAVADSSSDEDSDADWTTLSNVPWNWPQG